MASKSAKALQKLLPSKRKENSKCSYKDTHMGGFVNLSAEEARDVVGLAGRFVDWYLASEGDTVKKLVAAFIDR